MERYYTREASFRTSATLEEEALIAPTVCNIYIYIYRELIDSWSKLTEDRGAFKILLRGGNRYARFSLKKRNSRVVVSTRQQGIV